MSKQPTLPFTEAISMCSQADSPVSRLVSQAKEKARTITATYGQRCCERLERFSHVGLWVKTFSALLIGRTEWYSSRCNLIWRMRGTKYNRILFLLVPSMRPTEEIECGLLPTPTTNDSPNSSIPPSQIKRYNLAGAYLRGLLPTPRSMDSGGRGTEKDVVYQNGSYSRTNRKGVRFGVNLSDVLASGLRPTVKAQDCRHALHDKAKSNLGEEIAETFGDGTSQNSQLNPLFVAEMMGFPTDYTLLPFLRGAENPSKPTATP